MDRQKAPLMVAHPTLSPIEIARIALGQMAEKRIPPTPENYACEYRSVEGLLPKIESLGTAQASVETVQAMQGIADLLSASSADLATGVDQFQSSTEPIFTDVGSIKDQETLAARLQTFTVSALALRQSVASSRRELEETRARLEKVTADLKRTEELARTDALTGLCNRRAMDEIIGREIARARRMNDPFSIAILDADHFKAVNDRYGHAVGDKALLHLAFVAKSGIRETDVICRYGGEEFLIVLPGTNGEGARYVIDRLRVMMEKTPLALGSDKITIRVSGGVAELQPEEDKEALIARADQALYEAKRAGRNRVLVSTAKRAAA